MATWTYTITNPARNPVVYIMEDDGSGIITTPCDIFETMCFNSNTYSTILARRFYNNLVIGGSTFPPVCTQIAAGASSNVITVSASTQALKLWTYVNDAFVVQGNIVPARGGTWSDRETITVTTL